MFFQNPLFLVERLLKNLRYLEQESFHIRFKILVKNSFKNFENPLKFRDSGSKNPLKTTLLNQEAVSWSRSRFKFDLKIVSWSKSRFTFDLKSWLRNLLKNTLFTNTFPIPGQEVLQI